MPAPVTDVPPEYRPGAGDEARPGLFDLLPLPVVPCTDPDEPGLGTIDCPVLPPE